MAISTNQKPTIYRNLYGNTGPDLYSHQDFKTEKSYELPIRTFVVDVKIMERQSTIYVREENIYKDVYFY